MLTKSDKQIIKNMVREALEEFHSEQQDRFKHDVLGLARAVVTMLEEMNGKKFKNSLTSL